MKSKDEKQINSSETLSSAMSFTTALLALTQLTAVGAIYDPDGIEKAILPETVIHIDQMDSSGGSATSISYGDELTNEELVVQMENLFQKLMLSQTDVEPEFYSALYENRSEMYTQF